MLKSWWELGEWAGQRGKDLAIYQIECPFCSEKGNFGTEHHAEKKKPNSNKKLNFDTLKCGNCSNYVLVFWSASQYGIGKDFLHDYRYLPYPLTLSEAPEFWPKDVQRYWIQANRNLKDENWDAATAMARSALQLALRNKNAKGGSLKKEIEDLASQGVLPPLMKDWSDNVRELGNDAVHPKPNQNATSPEDATDIVRFLDFLLEYLYTLPKQISDFRKRKDGKNISTNSDNSNET